MTAASMLGAIFSALLLLCVPFYAVSICGMAFLVVPLMLLLSFGYDGFRQLFFKIAVSWLSIVILNGVVTAVYNLTGLESLQIYICILALLAARIMVKAFLVSVGKQQNQMELTIENDGKRVCCMGLYDSGNLLQIPQSGEPVHIISPRLLKRLQGENAIEEGQTIPYHALGTAEGKICVYQLEQIQFKRAGEWKILEHPWVGKADEALLQGKSYQVILNAKTVDNSKNKRKKAKKNEYI